MPRVSDPQGGPMAERRYIIVELSDAKALADAARANTGQRLDPVINRIDAETGGDIEEIVAEMKSLPICHACVVEGQEHSCWVPYAQKLGRRLRRLVERAGHVAPAAS